MGWAFPLIIGGVGLAALVAWLLLRGRQASAARRALDARRAALVGARVQVHAMVRLDSERARRLARHADTARRLRTAHEAGLSELVSVDLQIDPTRPSSWEPALLAPHDPGVQVILCELRAGDDDLRPARGRQRGPARLRLTLAAARPAPIQLQYLGEDLVSLDLGRAEAPRPIPAALKAQVRAFSISQVPVEPDPAPSEPAPAVRTPHPDRPSAWRFPCDVRFDVLAVAHDAFDPPPIAGLDPHALRPVGRTEAPERFAVTPPGAAPAEAVARVEAAQWAYAIQVHADASDGLGYLAEALTAAASLAREADGVIHDVHTGRLLTFEHARTVLKAPAFRIEDHVVVAHAGNRHYTRGLAKFGRADLELCAVPPAVGPVVDEALLELAHYLAQGQVFDPGEALRLGDADLEVREGTTRGSRYGFLAITSPGAPDAAPWGLSLLGRC